MTVELLDHGYIELVESWGSDERIIEAARMSTSKGFIGWGPIHDADCTATNPDVENACTCGSQKPGDEKLLRYLWTHKHHTPFEMAGATFEVQAPIFVFREWHRHRTQSYNELSARYTPLPDLNYLPSVSRLFSSDSRNKQASALTASLDTDTANQWLAHLGRLYQEAQDCYNHGLLAGVPKELARLCVPVARYSRMRASANLRNWLLFLTLRMDNAAMWEIRQYANALHDTLKGLFPRTMELFDEGLSA